MNRSQAIKESTRRWGKNGGFKDYGKPTNPERRQAADVELKALRAHVGDRAMTKEERLERDRLLGIALHYRYMVGKVVMGLFFSVEGQGDSLAEAFADADARAAREAARYAKKKVA
jgi:hypothetical protein